MATEAAESHQTSTTDEQVETKVNEEIKAIEQEKVSPSMETGVEEVPKAEESPIQADPTTESEEKTQDKQIEPPVVEDVEKTVETPVPDVPAGESLKVEKDYIPDSDTPSVADPVADEAKSQPEEQPAIKPVEKESQEQPEVEYIEKLPEDKQQIVDVPESSADTIEKPEEPLEVLPVKEAEAVVKEIEDSEVGFMKVGEPDAAVTEMKEKLAEQSELTQEVAKRCEVEPKENVEGDTVKGEETLASKVEDTTVLSKEQTNKDEEPNVLNSSEQVVSSYQEAQIDQNGDDGDSSLPGVVEKFAAEDEKYSSGVNVAEMLSKEAEVEVQKVGKENEAKTATTEQENSKNYIINEESTKPTKVEGVKSSTSTTEVTENFFEGESTVRDVQLAEEDKKDIKEEKPVLVETNKDEQAKEKLDEVTTAVNKQVEEFKESKLSAGDDTVETGGDKLEKENVGEIATSDVQNLESTTKDGNGTNTTKDLPKEVPAKPAQKQSNNIISKVKQSLVKAKKTITGKSPGSKTVAAETKGDSKVK